MVHLWFSAREQSIIVQSESPTHFIYKNKKSCVYLHHKNAIDSFICYKSNWEPKSLDREYLW